LHSTKPWFVASSVALITACGSDGSGSAGRGDDGGAVAGATSAGGAGRSSSGGADAMGGAPSSGGSSSGGSSSGGSSSGGSSSGGSSSGGSGAGDGGRNASGSGGTSGRAGSGGATSTGGSAAGGMGGKAGAGGATASCTSGSDMCPMASGLTHACEKRFALGINYAWHSFSADFGGISAWGQKSVSQDAATYDKELAAMHAQGVSVVRWWVFPDFRGDGVTFDANGDATGLSQTATADVAKALELAKKNDVHLTLTIFSFDDFRPDRTDNGIKIRGMAPMVTSDARRKKLVDNVVRALARAAAASPAVDHLLGWDVINEPEWAISATGNAPGGQDFSPNTELTAVTLAQMKSLIGESITALKGELPEGLTSVGWAAAKWAWAFQDVAVDFEQPHIYGWVDQYWPYTKAPSELGYPNKPVVMGEFFLRAMPFSDGGDNDSFAQIVGSWWDHGYAGAWAWQYNETPMSTLIQTFKTSKGCQAGF
jgi:hypothetical protein